MHWVSLIATINAAKIDQIAFHFSLLPLREKVSRLLIQKAGRMREATS